jgi:hypothetical protein
MTCFDCKRDVSTLLQGLCPRCYSREQWDKDLEKAIRDRDALFGRTLIEAFGEGIIDMVQIERLTGIFNRLRPDQPQVTPASPADSVKQL